MKRCPKCDTVKSAGDFYRKAAGGLSAYCKECTKEGVAQWQKEHPEQFRLNQRRSVLKRRYGLTEDDITRMLSEQKGRCPICRTPITADNLNVDHDHSDGRVRGLLCDRCNRTIGLLKDDAAVVRSAIRYVSRRKGVPDALF